jgi:uncharacterized protein YaiI (UPF0178 family)
MLIVFIDADGCPGTVKEDTFRIAARYQLEVRVVCNRVMNVPPSPRVSLVVVDRGADAADKFIAEQAGPGDIVITADLPLAARVIDGGAHPITPRGRVFDADSIGDALAARDLATTLRSFSVGGDEPRGGPPPMSKNDRTEFVNRFDALIHAVRRNGR